ncbi:Ribosome maturation factor RimM [Burkholderiales bacterium]|nr:Ribosome maturation factor RimM [Burkholderiales bacterium]
MVGPWGVRGWVKVAPYGDGPAGLAAQRTWWLAARGGAWQAYAVGEAREHSGNVVASIEGIADPETAATLKGREVAVPRSALPKPRAGEVYLADLVGLEVVGRSGVALGRVAGVEGHGAHPLLRVEGAEGAPSVVRLVPFVEPIVTSVDLAAGRIEVDWDAGW